MPSACLFGSAFETNAATTSRQFDEFRARIPSLESFTLHGHFFDDRLAASACADRPSNKVARPRALDLLRDFGAAFNKLRCVFHRGAKFRRLRLAEDVADATMRLGDGCHHRRALDGKSALA